MSTSNRVVIVVPVYRNELSEFEAISLRQAAKILGGHPFMLATFERIDTAAHERILLEYQVNAERALFNPMFFASIRGYNKLLTSHEFYQKFSGFEYLLLHQLDAFVFRDELQDWCARGYDYIGAPWLEGFEVAGSGSCYVGVGNGGLSLRSTRGSLRVLRSFSYIQKPRDLFRDFLSSWRSSSVRSVARFIKNLTFSNNTFFLFKDFDGNEDLFWGLLANRQFHWFRVPGVQEALEFSLEACPRGMFESNDRKLPFGCHAWWRYDLDFWRPYIENEGYKVGDSADAVLVTES